jgi:rhodanese-related sulfurtransferase
MKIHALTLLSCLALVGLVGCSKDAPGNAAEAADPHAAFTDLSVDDVSRMVADKKCVAVDANSSDTRQKQGVVPGAVLLSSYDKYDVAKELPAAKDTKLVFYCGGKACTAAPNAATLAKNAGYSDVNVMRAGISGLVAAGKPVDKPAS